MRADVSSGTCLLAAMGFVSRPYHLVHPLLSVTTPQHLAGRDQRSPAFTMPLLRAAPSEQTVHPTRMRG